jgi:hypothetical protein
LANKTVQCLFKQQIVEVETDYEHEKQEQEEGEDEQEEVVKSPSIIFLVNSMHFFFTLTIN